LPRGQRTMPVVRDGRFVGLVTIGDIRHVPREQWDEVPVGRVMIPPDRLHMVRPDQRVSDVLGLMTGADVNQLPVLEDGRLVGMLSRESVMRYLDIRQSLGLDAPTAAQQAPWRRPDLPATT